MTDSISILKTCSKCAKLKPLEAFPKSPRHKDKRTNPCKACKYLQTKARRDRNKDRVNALKRISSKRDKNKAQSRERVRRYKQAHPEKRRADNILYRQRRKARLQAESSNQMPNEKQ